MGVLQKFLGTGPAWGGGGPNPPHTPRCRLPLFESFVVDLQEVIIETGTGDYQRDR